MQIFPFVVSTLHSAWAVLKFCERKSDEEYVIIINEIQKTTYYQILEIGEIFKERHEQYFVVRTKIQRLNLVWPHCPTNSKLVIRVEKVKKKEKQGG